MKFYRLIALKQPSAKVKFGLTLLDFDYLTVTGRVISEFLGQLLKKIVA